MPWNGSNSSPWRTNRALLNTTRSEPARIFGPRRGAGGSTRTGRGATRGVADTVVPTVLQGVAFWVIMVPLNLYLSGPAGLGINGLFYGIGISVAAASLFLAIRFALVTRRHIRPV